MTSDSKAVVREFVAAVFNAKDATAVERLCAPDFQWHGGSAGEIQGAAAFAQMMGGLYAAFPDLHAAEEALIAEGELVAASWTIMATHAGPLFGAPASGRQLRWMGIDLYRVVDGRISEEWAGDDTLAILQQVGLVPTQ